MIALALISFSSLKMKLTPLNEKSSLIIAVKCYVNFILNTYFSCIQTSCSTSVFIVIQEFANFQIFGNFPDFFVISSTSVPFQPENIL